MPTKSHELETVTDPVAHGFALLREMGGAADAPTDALPHDFRARLDDLEKATPAQRGTERRRLLGIASNLFRLLGSADNGVVLRERRRQIRETLNAIQRLDAMQ
jgi:hypothetical protein